MRSDIELVKRVMPMTAIMATSLALFLAFSAIMGVQAQEIDERVKALEEGAARINQELINLRFDMSTLTNRIREDITSINGRLLSVENSLADIAESTAAIRTSIEALNTSISTAIALSVVAIILSVVAIGLAVRR